MISRSLYAFLLRLHPRHFRNEFGEEMLWIFDQARTLREAASLLADGVRSLATQWLFRSEMEEQNQLAGAGRPSSDRVPSFYTSDSDMPSPTALVNGLGLAVGVFALASAALFYGGRHERVFTYYSNDFHSGPSENRENTLGPSPPRGRLAEEGGAQPGFWAKVRSWLGKTPDKDVSVDSDVTAASPSKSGPQLRFDPPGSLEMQPGLRRSPDPSPNGPRAFVPPTLDGDNPSGSAIFPRRTGNEMALTYFKRMLILQALDTNHDGVISAEEIEKAPAALRTLDKNHDGKLDPEECGMPLPTVPVDKAGNPLPTIPDPLEVKRRKLVLLRSRFLFMHTSPVMHALDVNHDGVISADEIRNAPITLGALDLNGDRRLTLNELQPDPVAQEARGIFMLDSNADGKISASERLTPLGQHVSGLLDAADRNHDGQVTWEELADEIQLRADLNHDGVVTWEEMMKARRAGLLGGFAAPIPPGVHPPVPMLHRKSQSSVAI